MCVEESERARAPTRASRVARRRRCAATSAILINTKRESCGDSCSDHCKRWRLAIKRQNFELNKPQIIVVTFVPRVALCGKFKIRLRVSRTRFVAPALFALFVQHDTRNEVHNWFIDFENKSVQTLLSCLTNFCAVLKLQNGKLFEDSFTKLCRVFHCLTYVFLVPHWANSVYKTAENLHRLKQPPWQLTANLVANPFQHTRA